MKFTWRVDQLIRAYGSGGVKNTVYRVVRNDGLKYADCDKQDFADRIVVALNALESQTTKGL